MGTKNNPGVFDCYANAEPDEPMFVLLGRDASAAQIVRLWANERARQINVGAKPESDSDMVLEALECASAMERFYAERQRRKLKHLSPERGDSEPSSPGTGRE